jgi:hypothetical protein
MDVEKLLNVLYDIRHDEEELTFQKKFDQLLPVFSSNRPQNKSEGEFIKQIFTEIENAFLESIVNNYSPSNYNIVKEIGGEIFLGETGWKYFKTLSENENYNYPILIQNLKKYIKERSVFIAKVNETCLGLKEMGFEPHFYNSEIYEVGIIIPSEDKFMELPHVEKQLHQWNQIFKTLDEITGDEVSDAKLSKVSNGSLEFFFENSFATAACLTLAIERILEIYKKVLGIRVHTMILQKEIIINSEKQIQHCLNGKMLV